MPPPVYGVVTTADKAFEYRLYFSKSLLDHQIDSLQLFDILPRPDQARPSALGVSIDEVVQGDKESEGCDSDTQTEINPRFNPRFNPIVNPTVAAPWNGEKGALSNRANQAGRQPTFGR